MRLQIVRMRTLGLALIGSVAVLFAACADHGSSNATPTRDTTSPAAVVSRFFHWYVSERSLGRDAMARDSLQGNGDVTAGFIDSMESATASGRDPMLCSAQSPHEFTVGEPALSDEVAAITVASTESLAAWDVVLKFESSAWRVAAITCAVGR